MSAVLSRNPTQIESWYTVSMLSIWSFRNVPIALSFRNYRNKVQIWWMQILGSTARFILRSADLIVHLELQTRKYFPKMWYDSEVPVSPVLVKTCFSHCLLDMPLVLFEHVIHVSSRGHQWSRIVDSFVLDSITLQSFETSMHVRGLPTRILHANKSWFWLIQSSNISRLKKKTERVDRSAGFSCILKGFVTSNKLVRNAWGATRTGWIKTYMENYNHNFFSLEYEHHVNVKLSLDLVKNKKMMS